MIEERTGCNDLLATRSHGGRMGFLGDPVEDALHTAEVQRSLGLGWSDGWRGLCKCGRGEQSDKHEFRFHGGYYRWLG
jgi:hypothetical protein